MPRFRKANKFTISSALAATIVGSMLFITPQTALAAPNAAKQTQHVGRSAVQVGFRSSAVSKSNALRSAQQYIQMMPFSRTGHIKQLMFEGYSRGDSTYAVDRLHANWNVQAKLAAKQYLNTMPFSRSALISQLKFEGFTTSQATYGVKKAGL